ncbi:MAG TPA: hypothetical protein VLG44_00680 [Chlamydiales bacterium]|nr:hypothetical protein [Chlamydiales bacterium]
MKKFLFITLFLSLACGYADQVSNNQSNNNHYTPLNNSISLNNIRMNVIHTDASGVVNHETIFYFSESNGVISAEYSGGKISQGFLVGKFTNDNQLVFSYCQMQVDGKLDFGTSQCTVSRANNGKIILTEHFEWASRPGEFGTNIFQEM